MNWTHFLMLLAALYLLYYLFTILLDISKQKRSGTAGAESNELTFSEHHEPAKLADEPAGVPAVPAERVKKQKPAASEVLSSGGVGITDLFRLAKQEAIIYTQSVSF